ncbi:hypothetical protein SDRG_08987 [Saprolegnia diclina VS20]|uniref:Transmembrane protein 19 n=1 Tax=Saprolegnia diclina (strain VS20) TaxID=1156394 RepID=T0RT89_SAPDV|nr:hypothetical protein SDRG_08987 [Saprolegnia diclina VS20]EQC33477.1 hypothetical protein SDRG_08987 [Saprolegnia diclina VS20]|eukprot:XP_008613117.1 hypothetical protein SDRG_08987 [Saprolegnia diclina VS20]
MPDATAYSTLGLRVVVGVLVGFAAARRGLKKKSLDRSGAIAAFLVGAISMACGYRFGILLLGFYFSGSKLTTFQEAQKATLDASVKEGGQRSARQVLACSLLACIVCIVYAILYLDDAPLNASARPTATFLWGCYIGHYACCAADTWASELGVLAPGAPILITNWCKRVPPGTNGGVSFVGTLASAAGGAFIGLLFYVYGAIFLASSSVPQWPAIPFGLCMGVLGSVLDSVLGATVQITWYDESAQKIVSAPATHEPFAYRHVCGYDVLSNEQVNLVSVALTTLGSGYLAQYFF